MLLILLDKYIAGDCTVEEQAAIERWYGEYDEREDVLPNADQLQAKYIAMYNNVRAAVYSTAFNNKSIKTRRWLRYAAAAVILLAFGLGIYIFNTQSYKSRKSNESQFRQETQANIAPGTNKAIWTLTDGKQIELDSTVLDMTQKPSADLGFNELRTPPGGQYQLILPDGSKVWLNAASSIKYPVVFVGRERRVEVSGEVYMEVAKNLDVPFRVSTGNSTIQVLGTSFNINAYPEEESQRTTLISGSVKVVSNNQEAILKPGEQASISITPITKIKQITVQTTNIEQAIAWKNGLFSFNRTPLKFVMRQLERWYNIEVIYEGNIPSKQITAEIFRGAPLSDVLEGLKFLNVNFSVDGKRLIVRP